VTLISSKPALTALEATNGIEIDEYPGNPFAATFVGRLNTCAIQIRPPEDGLGRVQLPGDIVTGAKDGSRFGGSRPPLSKASQAGTQRNRSLKPIAH
jgi:hypothetical protein